MISFQIFHTLLTTTEWGILEESTVKSTRTQVSLEGDDDDDDWDRFNKSSISLDETVAAVLIKDPLLVEAPLVNESSISNWDLTWEGGCQKDNEGEAVIVEADLVEMWEMVAMAEVLEAGVMWGKSVFKDDIDWSYSLTEKR